ncbi:MAG: hypothetical protein ABIG56_00470 [Candidatus Omnitrophota bacterium]
MKRIFLRIISLSSLIILFSVALAVIMIMSIFICTLLPHKVFS